MTLSSEAGALIKQGLLKEDAVLKGTENLHQHTQGGVEAMQDLLGRMNSADISDLQAAVLAKDLAIEHAGSIVTIGSKVLEATEAAQEVFNEVTRGATNPYASELLGAMASQYQVAVDLPGFGTTAATQLDELFLGNITPETVAPIVVTFQAADLSALSITDDALQVIDMAVALSSLLP